MDFRRHQEKHSFVPINFMTKGKTCATEFQMAKSIVLKNGDGSRSLSLPLWISAKGILEQGRNKDIR